MGFEREELVRHIYLKKICDFKDSKKIKALSGLRRCGKSIILNQFKKELIERNPFLNIISLNFSDKDTLLAAEQNGLIRLVNDKLKENYKNFLFIDDVQFLKSWHTDLKELTASKKFNIFITVSSCFLIPNKIKMDLNEIIEEIKIYPFSFKEYCDYFKVDSKSNQQLNNYLMIGGLPGSYQYNDLNSKMVYINKLAEAIMRNDIQFNEKSADFERLDCLFDLLIDNLGNELTKKNIFSILKSRNKDFNYELFLRQLSLLKDSFPFYELYEYDYSSGKESQKKSKFYLSDPAFRNSRMNTIFLDRPKIIENTVALELMRRYEKVCIGDDVDFIAFSKRDKRSYYQVCLDITNAVSHEKKVKSLLKIKDTSPKTIITDSKEIREKDLKGIRVIDLIDWLNEKV